MPKPKILWLRLPHTQPLSSSYHFYLQNLSWLWILLRFPIVMFCLCLHHCTLLRRGNRCRCFTWKCQVTASIHLQMSLAYTQPGPCSVGWLVGWVGRVGGYFSSMLEVQPTVYCMLRKCFAIEPSPQAPTLSYFKQHFLVHCSSFHLSRPHCPS